jgi:hypothetical protein
MRTHFLKAILIAGTALAVSACNRGGTANKAAANEVEANVALTAPANDASAMEIVPSRVEPLPAPAANSTGTTTGQTSGGDTGGNNVEANTVGM